MSIQNKTGVVEALDSIQQGFYDDWQTREVVSKIFFGNLDRSKILDDNNKYLLKNPEVKGNLGEGFVSHSILHTSGQQVALGRKKHDQRGSITLSIYTENGRGRQRADAILMDQALSFFQRGTVNGVVYWNSTPNEVGDFGRWWVTDVVASFLYTIDRGI